MADDARRRIQQVMMATPSTWAEKEYDRRLGIILEVDDEMQRQDVLWGAFRRFVPHKGLGYLMEEVGEAAEAINEEDLAHAKVELIQAAAVAIQLAASFDRELQAADEARTSVETERTTNDD